MLGEPLLEVGEVRGRVAGHEDPARPGEDGAGGGEDQFPVDEPLAGLLVIDPPTGFERSFDGHWPLEPDRERARHRHLVVEQGHVAEHLVEHSGGPAAVGDAGSALMFGRADDPEVGDAGSVESLGGQPQPALAGTATGATQGDTTVGPRRLLEVAAGPRESVISTHYSSTV